MHPSLWFWAPQIHFPWSGGVAQNIEPNTSWFSDLIAPGAGNARIEERAFSVASYGKQLGLITEVLIEAAEQSAKLSPKAMKSLESLKSVKAEIETIKTSEYETSAANLALQVQAIRERGGAEYESLVRRLLPLLGATGS